MRGVAAAVVVAVLSGAAVHAAGIHPGPTFTTADLGELADGLGDVLTFPNLCSAAPSGITGFDVLAAAGGPQVDTGAAWWHAVDGSTAGGFLYGQRLIARKGLPLHLDVGVQGGKVFGESFWGGEVRWAFLEGGAVSPAAALRVTYSRLAASGVEADVAEAQLVVSKGFLVVTPYAGLGYRRASAAAVFGEPTPVRQTADEYRWVGTVGARLALLPVLHLVAEFRQGFEKSLFVGVGVGL